MPKGASGMSANREKSSAGGRASRLAAANTIRHIRKTGEAPEGVSHGSKTRYKASSKGKAYKSYDRGQAMAAKNKAKSTLGRMKKKVAGKGLRKTG
jgi:hypothetical protein